ncbi:MAG TPA: NfeD family protein [Chitinispirillaceae bacterium]|nr:NfeD family protein [Chitinispirillaceae bacterium]
MIKEFLWPVLLQLLGIVVIIAEFILPSAGMLTIAALGLFGYSLFMVFSSISITAGFIFLVIDLIMVPVLIWIGIRILAASPATLKTTLKSDDGVTVLFQDHQTLLGMDGMAVTDLRPAGTAIINGKRYDVVSNGEYIKKSTTIKVTAVNGNRIVVKVNN